MGAYSYLVGWDPKRGAGVRPELEAKNYLPLFWMTMFDPDDVRDARDSAFVKPPNATDAFEDTTYAYCDGPTALTRLRERLPRIGAATNEVLAAKFTKFAATYAKQPVLLRLSGLAVMSDQFVSQLREHLAAVADPATSAEQLRELGGLSQGWEGQPYADNILAGWGTKLTAQEREQVKTKKASSKAERDQRDRTDQWRTAIEQTTEGKPYSASGTFAEGDVIEHGKFGRGIVQRIIDRTKIEVLFENSLSVLAHKP